MDEKRKKNGWKRRKENCELFFFFWKWKYPDPLYL